MNTIHVHPCAAEIIQLHIAEPSRCVHGVFRQYAGHPFMCASVGDYVTMSQLWHISLFLPTSSNINIQLQYNCMHA